MTAIGLIARSMLRLAAWVAGPERAEWAAAMAAEADAAGRQALPWALGCLAAIVHDRFRRDRWFLLALLLLPAVDLVVVVGLGLVAAVTSRAIGLSGLAMVPIMLFGPLPVAWLLGRLRPTSSPLAVGTAAFLVHQSIPILAMWWMTGRAPWFWAPNVTYYNMPQWAGLGASWLVWAAGVWWGAGGRSRTVRPGS